MNIEKTTLKGVLIIDPRVFKDTRGYFLETFNKQRYLDSAGIDVEFVQDNLSRSTRGVLRGLHFQKTRPQAKLVRVVTGEVWDVAVDIDPQSPTFRHYVGATLSAANQRQLFIPAGYAHGFCVLSEYADFEYKCSEYYVPGDEGGLAWNDPDIGIDWPISNPALSEKDAKNPTLAALIESHIGRR